MMPPNKSLAVLLASALTVSPVQAHHTTDHTNQQLEYERQQREYWRQQERKREEERRQQQIWQDDARRQQEQSNRARTSTPSSSPDLATPSRGSGAPRSSGGDAAALCKAHPVGAGERNPLIGGQWRPVNAPTGDAFTQLFQMATLGVCAVFQAGIEFRERTHVNAIGEFPIQYGHKGDVWFACFPDTTFAFRVENTNQISVAGVDPPCRLRREGAASAQTTPRSNSASPPLHTFDPTTSAALSLAAGFAAPGGAYQPVVGGNFFVLNESADVILAKAGFTGSPGNSPLKAWTMACASGEPNCGQGMMQIVKSSIGVMKTDSGGKAQLPSLPSGTYYVFGLNKVNAEAILWHVKTDLGPGAQPVRLDQRNAMRLN
jgi:hypothetical protein